jgi:glycosyltransferase involved in cell wall biosynthesis
VAGERIPILYLAPWVDLGGSDKGTIDWFKHVDRGRWAPSLITTQPSPNRWLRHVEPFAEEVWELPDLMPGAMFPESILGFIESRGVRLVHIMNSRLGFDLLPDMACLPEPPAVVVQMHAEEPNQAGYVRYVTRRYGNLIDAFSVTSEHLKRTVADYEIAPSRIEVILSGVDGAEEFDPERVEPLALGGNGLPRVLWPGRLVEQKDPMLTLDVLVRARELGGEFLLDVVGDGHMKAATQARAEELGVADMIAWHPPSQEMPRWYRSSDLMLMTSVYEGVPYVIYESLAMGVPVVAPALPGNLEFMDGDSGALIEPRDDAEGYARALVELLGDEGRRRAMGGRSRRRMLSEFSLEDMGRRHDELYERLLASRPASSRWRHDELFGEREGEAERPADEPATAPRLGRDPAPPRTVGVVVPCYRHGIFLGECIDSIKAQTLAPARVVVVDDGSDDRETIEALAGLDADPAVEVLRLPENAGPSTARNRAIAELDTSYVLSVDADDALLPDALERMLARLEGAPEDVGFVYPHVQHTGNRSDYVAMPAYNAWLLMKENYCPSPALFDRRVFEGTGVAYPEDIVVGHEDWDLILQLAERGIHGLHADGPTFLYRRLGFSRINAVEYGPHAFHDLIARRHPALYSNPDEIKARWAPALSIVLLDWEGAEWADVDASGLDGQTCRDFEALHGSEATLQAAIGEARGRWVCLLTPPLAPALRNRAFVEQLLTAFVADERLAAIVLADAPAVDRHALSQLDDDERRSARPAGVAFERRPMPRLPKVRLEGADSALLDLAAGMQANGPVQWRLAPVAARAGDAGPSAADGRYPFELDLNTDRSDDRSVATTRDIVCGLPPRLPELTAGTVRRWEDAEGWAPPETQLLCRHREEGGEARVLSHDREPPKGFALEFVLGSVHAYAAPGTRRLVQVGQEFELSDDQNELGEGRQGYGYVEQQPLPLLEQLELRRVPGTGAQVLVAGPDDPLFGVAEPVATLGWIEAHPILPRGGLTRAGAFGLIPLRRRAEMGGRRHTYATEEDGVGGVLGSLFPRPGEELVELRRRADGRLVSDLARPGRATRDPRKVGRWLAEPLRAGAGRRGAGASLGRAGHLTLHFRARRHSRGDGGTVLGWLLREFAVGCSPLFSTTHPVTGDQLVTCSTREALDHGYLPDGVLGYIPDVDSDRAR